MSKMSYIGVHHAGGLGTDNYASTQKLTLASIDAGHKSRWPTFPSDIKNPVTNQPYFTGYNIVIPADGKWVQTRLIGAETAAQIGHNFDTISICVVGNFMKRSNGQPVDVMTPAQVQSLEKLLKGIIALDFTNLGLKVASGTSFDLSLARIHPHRVLHPKLTDCYGTYYPDDWARQLAVVKVPTPIVDVKPMVTPEDVANLLSYQQQIQLLFMKIQDLFAKKRFGKQALGAPQNARGCGGFVLEI